MRRITALITVLVLIVAACGDSDSDDTAAAAEPESTTQAAQEPTTTPPPGTHPAEEIDVRVGFDGETCTYAGPVAVPDGTHLVFEFETDYDPAALLVALVDEGTTWDQFVEWNATHPANEYPPFATKEEGVRFGSGRLDMTLPEGKYAIGCSTAPWDTNAAYPAALIEVVAG